MHSTFLYSPGGFSPDVVTLFASAEDKNLDCQNIHTSQTAYTTAIGSIREVEEACLFFKEWLFSAPSNDSVHVARHAQLTGTRHTLVPVLPMFGVRSCGLAETLLAPSGILWWSRILYALYAANVETCPRHLCLLVVVSRHHTATET